jgi:hypothetical protein
MFSSSFLTIQQAENFITPALLTRNTQSVKHMRGQLAPVPMKIKTPSAAAKFAAETVLWETLIYYLIG